MQDLTIKIAESIANHRKIVYNIEELVFKTVKMHTLTFTNSYHVKLTEGKLKYEEIRPYVD